MQERRGKLVGMRGTGGANVGNEREMNGKPLGLRGADLGTGKLLGSRETKGANLGTEQELGGKLLGLRGTVKANARIEGGNC